MPTSAPRVRVLGPVEVDAVDGAVSTLAGPTARALVAALALASPPGSSVGVEALADEVWGEGQPRHPRASVQTLVSRIRQVAGVEIIRSDAAGYAIAPDAVDLVCAQARHDDAVGLPLTDAARLTALDDALALWRGEVGGDLGDAPAADALRAASARLRDALRRERARTLDATGRAADAVPAWRALHDAQPYDDEAAAGLLASLRAAGRTSDALAVFAAHRARLRDDLGSSPGPALVAAHAALLREDAPVAGRVRIGLRSAPTPLIGRDGDLAAVATLLAEARIVTILGAGGLGKTRLAQAAAAASDADLVAVVPLAGVRTDEDVPFAIAAALGITEAATSGRLSDQAPRPDLRARVLAMIGERHTLVVLDNCEQIVAGAAAWVADVVRAAPGLRVLTTSRTPLDVSGEVVLALDPLPIADDVDAPAVRLFVERARAVRPGARLDPVVVARLCTHLDGLPLAIELAAARVRTMTPEQIEQRLGDRFAILTTGPRDAPERHRTLEAVIAWSWDLLDASAQRAWERLAVFPAGFAAEAAASVIGVPGADDVLERLVSHSLLIAADDPQTGAVRFRMLETVREFGMSRLGPDAHDDALDAVARWAVAFAAERLATAFDERVHAEIFAEHDNLVSVTRRAAASGDDATVVTVYALLVQTWLVRGSITELTSFGTVAIEAMGRVRDDAVPPDAAAVLLTGTAAFALITTRVPAARPLARLALFRRRRAPISPVFAGLADVILATRDRVSFDAAIGRLRASSDPSVAALGELVRAQATENDGDHAIALAASRRAWDIATAGGVRWLATAAASSVSELSSQVGAAADALEWFERAAEGFRVFGADEQVRQQGWVVAGNLIGLGRFDEARARFAALVEAAEVPGADREIASIGWFGLAETDRAEGDTDRSADEFARAIDTFVSGDQRNSPWYLITLGAALSAASIDGTGTPERRALWARRLRVRAIVNARVRPQLTDHPVLGTVLLGWSAWALDQPGLAEAALAALALAESCGVRQDFPSLRLDAHLARAERIAGADAVARARSAEREQPREGRAERSFTILRG
ncbi:MAG: hypothetical protein J0I33_13355 [Microbacterium ginsengisoli]|uniref:ATP-binding protein n=2 Tax=Microbacteriaceae TaxID=85023 RepID=UPI0006F76F9E|nr:MULTISPECIES: BTAD domain-containing putative transcriptional regulator [unclassified Microbacterium]KQS02453.1 hypothetical protein ASF93_10410 [Microbacterium sp. Leaf347]MBN9199616.1 hypothetical protein [Microbacterium ginsengisoli]OJU76794.1 MAG: hypothetical protein BGO15_08535 [Microbacterium sp. 71-23]